MKKIIYILTFITLSLNAQNGTIIDVELEPYVVEFVQEAKKRNIDGVSVVLKLKKIVFVEMDSLGFYDSINKNILIKKGIKSKSILRTIVFHEIGHSMKKKHTCYECPDLMSYILYSEYKRVYFANEEIWQKSLNKFFKPF